ncbi:DUF1330 domain-containing protein [Catellatospora coxensis]|uniref:DUF1330 domain-containing protein n=1 Tax=Catellatospora coxensis TaxID=310354 RepID=A0A8J3KZ17_9ACTN|nr:DUF1330 domain-containing protein [Catellatospora coxensis]GIG05661.1 hypothetical protein Cco03nite_23610 [Catellatospora coxensis]
MSVDPSEGDLARFVVDGPDGPFVMLNLLRFNEGGRERYAEYARRFRELVADRYGVTTVYAGDGGAPLVAGSGSGWDAVLLVAYPDRAAFGRMVADPDYQQIAHLRASALAETVLQPTQPWGRPRPGA